MKLTKAHARKVLNVVDAGLSTGLGKPEPGKMCVEAAVCYALGLPHGDNPECVGSAVRTYKIRLNDGFRGTKAARAKLLRRLAIAQLGSDTLDQGEFVSRLAVATVNKVLPLALTPGPLRDACESARTLNEARDAADAAYAANAAAYAASAYADDAAYVSAECAVQILVDMQSSGARWLDVCEKP